MSISWAADPNEDDVQQNARENFYPSIHSISKDSLDLVGAQGAHRGDQGVPKQNEKKIKGRVKKNKAQM